MSDEKILRVNPLKSLSVNKKGTSNVRTICAFRIRNHFKSGLSRLGSAQKLPRRHISVESKASSSVKFDGVTKTAIGGAYVIKAALLLYQRTNQS